MLNCDTRMLEYCGGTSVEFPDSGAPYRGPSRDLGGETYESHLGGYSPHTQNIHCRSNDSIRGHQAGYQRESQRPIKRLSRSHFIHSPRARLRAHQMRPAYPPLAPSHESETSAANKHVTSGGLKRKRTNTRVACNACRLKKSAVSGLSCPQD